jgi:mono/diheme cytochrome c family protein
MQLTLGCHGAAAGRRESRTALRGTLPLGLFVAFAGLSAGPSPAPAADGAPAPSRLAQHLFANYCTQCHGADGKGGPGRAGAGTPGAVAMPEIPDFTNRPWQQTRSNVQLAVSILEGKNQHMPANRGMVTDELARELVAYVRTFAPAPQPAVAKAAPASAQAPPRTTAGPVGTPAAPFETASVPAYTPTGDFDADFDHYMTELQNLQRQARALAAAPAARSPSPVTPPAPVAPPAATPTTAAPPAAEPPAAAPPEAAPPVSAPPANQVVYLTDKPPAAANKPPAADTSPQPLQFLLTGLGGAVLGLAVLSALWGAFTRRRTPAVPDGRLAPTVSPGRPEFAPAPMDCVGAGL